MERLYTRILKRRDTQIGLALILVFVAIGALAPLIAAYPNPYLPTQQYVAAPNAFPSWIKLFPGYSDLNPNIIIPPTVQLQAFKTADAISYWATSIDPPLRVALTVDYAPTTGPTGLAAATVGSYTLANTGQGSELINVTGESDGPVYVVVKHTFYYGYSPPPIFYSQVVVKPVVPAGVGVAVFLFVNTSNGVYYTALSANPAGRAALESLPRYGYAFTEYFSQTFSQQLLNNTWNLVSGITTGASSMPLAYLNSSIPINQVAQTIFSSKGNYTVGELIAIFPPPSGGQIRALIYQSDLKFQIFGRVYGILGTDWNGGSVWSDFVSGTRAALIIGFGSAAITIAIGVALGLIAGFFAGLVDSVLIFVFDFLLLLPGLILLIDLDTILTVAHVFANKVLLIIVILGLLSWAFPARTIRSQVLSLRRRTYVEAAKTMGASNFYILKNHILKHTAGTIIAIVTYTVPGLVIADTGLDFLGLGISASPTWGNILSNLINYVTPANQYLWWITLPVGLAIILISVGFYLVGSAIQEELGRYG